MSEKLTKREGFKWERREGCQCKSCPWKGNCLGETRSHWIEARAALRKEQQ